MIITDRTPFYAESGGQQADNGVIEGNGALGQVVHVQKQKEYFMHTVKVVNGVHNFFEGAEVKLTVNENKKRCNI